MRLYFAKAMSASCSPHINKKELEKWIQEYADKNDGTIVTSGAFANFVRYQKPIEKILAYIYEPFNQN